MAIHFYFLTSTTLKERRKLKKFIVEIAVAENRIINSLNIIFCTDEYLLDINNQYLHHNYYTDIITFDLIDNPDLPIEGEIYLSVDRVNDNASNLGVTRGQELLRVIFHGVLHLCGYKDKSPANKKLMTQKENHYLGDYAMFHVEHSQDST